MSPRSAARPHVAPGAATLGLPGRPLIRRLIEALHETPLGPSWRPQSDELSTAGDSLAAGRAEFEDGPHFFRLLDGALTADHLRDRDVLDLGCGYGGRTIWYEQQGAPRSVTGLEIDERMVERCRALAERLDARRTRFVLGVAEHLPFEDDSFDEILSFDVLEHVADPRIALAEIERTLRPGGRGCLVFPTYRGMFSAHLDYVTKAPGLHRVFDPDVLIAAVNDVLEAHCGEHRTAKQPAAATGPWGTRVLPTLNGLTLRSAREAVAQTSLTIEAETITPAIRADMPLPGARHFDRILGSLGQRGLLPEFLVWSIGLVVRAPGTRRLL